ncbi:diadenylate cyclase [Peijinzhouia sedimentorum]
MIYLFKIGFLDIRWIDLLDILAVGFLIFQLYKLLKGSVALRVFLGLLSLYLIYLVVRAAQMELLSSILGQFMSVGVLAAIILFQQEIRKFLLIIGKTTALNRENIFAGIFGKRTNVGATNITPIIEASKIMAGSNTGALIVFSKSSELKFYQESGDIMDAEISKRLLLAIFNKYSPLHDGAVVIFENRIKAARCILPVTERENLPAQLGLRHRAAIGMTESTDTLVLIVSEETGQISTARNGIIYSNLSPQEARQRIHTYLFEDEEDDGGNQSTDAKSASPEKVKSKKIAALEEPESAN